VYAEDERDTVHVQREMSHQQPPELHNTGHFSGLAVVNVIFPLFSEHVPFLLIRLGVHLQKVICYCIA